MTNTVTISRELLQTLLDAADAGIELCEMDADDSGAEIGDRRSWSYSAMIWRAAVRKGLDLLRS